MSQPPAIEFDQLTKTFGTGRSQVRAVHNLELSVAAGQVYGFLGANGAGKTTTIRLLMDLVRPTRGAVRLFGQDVRHPAALRRAGALIEGPAFYSFLSGRANLQVLADVRQVRDPARLDTLLGQVGLAEAAHRRAGHYSTGMRQRLGLAAALLHDPDLVLLDEPTNGLDPAGLQDMRAFIRALATTQGKTVFLSSHLLGEVEQICDRVAILHHGEIVREGLVADLLAARGRLRVEAQPLDQAAAILAAHGRVRPDGPHALWVEATYAEAAQLNQQLVAAGVAVYHLAHQRQSLEEYFLAVTSPEPPHA